MLASPGNSPRHIEPPSPSPSLQSVDNEGALAIRGFTSGLVVPRPAKRARWEPIVLDEDTYTAGMNMIIERDFFPDISKLQSKAEWLEAVRSGNAVLIVEAQRNIIRRDQARKNGATPMGFATPGSVMGTPAGFMTPSVAGDVASTGHGLVDGEGRPVNTSLSLDQFLRRYTSEDNASFSKIIEKTNKKRRETYKLLESSSSQQQRLVSGGDRQTDGYGTSNQPLSTLDGWGYTTKNALMYNAGEREDAPLTESEKEARMHGPPKEINIQSTRFHEKIFGSKQPEEETIVAVDPAMKKAADERYGYVRTPSPAPGVDASPFVTWGEIDGTPLRLEMEETPVGIGGSGDGPHFKIPAPPVRDTRAHHLSREASRNIRERSRLGQPRTPLSCPSPAAASGSATPSGLSAAAQRFVNRAIAKNCASVDAKLRASYGASTTPGTPRMARNAVRSSREGSVTRSPSVFPSPSPSPFRQPNI